MKLIYMVDGNVFNAEALISIEARGEDDTVITLQGGKELVYRMQPHSMGIEITKAMNSLNHFVVGKGY